MSVELSAVSNLIAGVKKSTGKGQAGLSKISKSAKGAVTRKEAAKAKEEKSKARESARNKKKEEGSKSPSKTEPTKTTAPKGSNKTTSTPKKSEKKPLKEGYARSADTGKPVKISATHQKNIDAYNAKKASSSASRPNDAINLEEPTFTPKPKSNKPRVTQPSLPGMSRAKIVAK